jgi:hypothetical protein
MICDINSFVEIVPYNILVNVFVSKFLILFINGLID